MLQATSLYVLFCEFLIASQRSMPVKTHGLFPAWLALHEPKVATNKSAIATTNFCISPSIIMVNRETLLPIAREVDNALQQPFTPPLLQSKNGLHGAFHFMILLAAALPALDDFTFRRALLVAKRRQQALQGRTRNSRADSGLDGREEVPHGGKLRTRKRKNRAWPTMPQRFVKAQTDAGGIFAGVNPTRSAFRPSSLYLRGAPIE